MAKQSLVAPARERGLKYRIRRGRPPSQSVAPARERGLKLFGVMHLYLAKSRSREGAWIEMLPTGWVLCGTRVAPARERGLKCPLVRPVCVHAAVAPARERGLKFILITPEVFGHMSLPRGSVD